MPELDFKGKEFVRNHHLTVPYRPLLPDAEKSVGEVDLNGNLIIHGDNLNALKALLPMYAGKVDCIFIDPPYNTGNEDWEYNDNVNSPVMKEWFKENPVGIDDTLRHDKWCAMMWPRVKLLWELLSEAGVLWVTLDDNEIHRMKSIIEECAGNESQQFVCQAVWQKRTSPDARKNLAAAHDYVLCFRKSKELADLNLLQMSESRESDYSNPDNDERGPWASTDLGAQAGHATKDQFYTIVGPTGKSFTPAQGRCWGVAETTYLSMKADNRIWFGVKGDARPRIKLFLREREGVTEWTWWTAEQYGSTQDAKKELLTIIGTEWDETPKPVSLVSRVLSFSKKDIIVLDSFAGSGTTAHAVLNLNKQDGGNRKFILVEMENYASNVTAERVRRVMNGYPYKGKQKDVLLEKQITWSELKKKGDALSVEAENMKAMYKANYSNIKIEVDNGVLKVIGENDIEETMPGLGGSFTYCTLGEPLNLEKMLFTDNLPERDSLGDWLLYLASGTQNRDAKPNKLGGLDDIFLAKQGNTYYWFIYQPDRKFLGGPEAALTLTLAEKINSVDPTAIHRVFSPAKYVSQKVIRDKGWNIEHAPIPMALFNRGI